MILPFVSRPPWRTACCACLVAALAGLLAVDAAAVPTADLGGVVRSVDGAPLAGVEVLAFERSLGRRVATRSDDAGRYRFLGLTVGEWTVEASRAGYTIAVVEDLRLDVGVTRRLDLELEPSDFEEMVVTSYFSPLVPTGIDGAEVIDREDFDGLPFLTRSVRRVEALLDGPPVTVDERRVDGVLGSGDLPLEAVAQISLRSTHSGSPYAAGRGVVRLLTRSGTQTLQGDVFALHTDDDLQENASPRLGRRTWIGGSLGGALVEDVLHGFVATEDTLEDTVEDTVEETDRPYADGRRSVLHLSAASRQRSLVRLRLAEDRASSTETREILLGFQGMTGERFHHGVGLSLRRLDFAGASRRGLDTGSLRWDFGSWRPVGAMEHEVRGGFRLFETEKLDAVALGGTRAAYLEDEIRFAGGWSVRGGVRWEERSGLARRRDGEDEISPRLGVAWNVGGNGRHVVRLGVGRFVAAGLDASDATESPFEERERVAFELVAFDQASVGWSWRLGPFLGLAFDARRLETADDLRLDFDEESADITLRGRFTDALRFRVHWGLFERGLVVDERRIDEDLRHRVVASVTVDTPWQMRFGAVYRYLTWAESGVDPASQLDVRMARAFDLGVGPRLEASLEIFDLLDQANNFDSPTDLAGMDLAGTDLFGMDFFGAGQGPARLHPFARVGLRLRF